MSIKLDFLQFKNSLIILFQRVKILGEKRQIEIFNKKYLYLNTFCDKRNYFANTLKHKAILAKSAL